jgi:glycosyltransferase involved in cell wall biosynthesis
MKISIITPSFNQGAFIEQTIRSVMVQDCKEVEHIVIDGGSTDDTVSILSRYPHLKWTSEKDSGQSGAINKGFAMASGDVVAWLNSDDYYEKDIFGEIVGYFTSHPDCQCLYGDITFVDRQGHELSKVIGDTINLESLIRCPDIVRQPSCFWRKEILKEVGTLDESLHLVMDFDLFLRISKRYPMHYLHRNLSYYRYYDENKSLSRVRRQVKEIYRVYRKNGIRLNVGAVRFLVGKYLQSFDPRKVDASYDRRAKEE